MQNYPTATRRMVMPLTYGPFRRCADVIDGRRDRPIEGPDETPWLQRLRATWGEQDALLLAATAENLSTQVRRLNELAAVCEELERVAAAGDERVAHLPAPDLGVRSPAEAHLSAEAVSTRRHREHAARLVAAQAESTAARAHLRAARSEYATLLAEVEEMWARAVALSDRHRNFYDRRLSTYRRARYRSATPAGLTLLPRPPWAAQPCPWVPSQPVAALS